MITLDAPTVVFCVLFIPATATNYKRNATNVDIPGLVDITEWDYPGGKDWKTVGGLINSVPEKEIVAPSAHVPEDLPAQLIIRKRAIDTRTGTIFKWVVISIVLFGLFLCTFLVIYLRNAERKRLQNS
ncbi:hypothetical protein NDU88_002163 [Pleurodeles waltl]|uniref:Uncharacterized protein n=1 Tax=Pleurodeles waltl TaxID=8319 RepID=A0AAV7T1B8_PLEWA|nr:hypothetical protein NDU88_002163 [Pleurodeles waltl]